MTVDKSKNLEINRENKMGDTKDSDEMIQLLENYLSEKDKIRVEVNRRYQKKLMIDNADGEYQPGPDSQPQEDVPRGTITLQRWHSSGIYAGSERNYWLYVPEQYDPQTPAALMVFLDGEYFLNEKLLPTLNVLDNLIAKGDIPTMIVLFVNPGEYPGEPISNNIAHQPRQLEYDSQNDRFVRLLIEEIIPEISSTYAITDNPEQRGICGASSGAMAAWTAAWERPDAFRKVLSFIGSFVDIHGGHSAAFNIRKFPPKPIRVLLQSGSNDQNLEYGDWPLANKTMASALAYADYDYRFIYGNGRHDYKHASAILPDAMRWLWR
jgi:enterochelin esterase-like enzyme